MKYDGQNFNDVRDWLGKRPGDYRIDPWYLRKGMGQKPYCWDDFARKWRLVRIGDIFTKEHNAVYHETGNND